MKLYHSRGHSYLVCPKLIELDDRHGKHWSKWHPCWKGELCPVEHDHDPQVADGGGHRVVDFHWHPGCRPPSPAEHPLCGCGRPLVWADLHDLYGDEHVSEAPDES